MLHTSQLIEKQSAIVQAASIISAEKNLRRYSPGLRPKTGKMLPPAL